MRSFGQARNAENNQKDPFLEFAQFLRTKHGIEWRTGIAGGERVEYFRGKDFASFLKENSDKMEALPGIEPLKPGATATHGCHCIKLLLALNLCTVSITRMLPLVACSSDRRPRRVCGAIQK